MRAERQAGDLKERVMEKVMEKRVKVSVTRVRMEGVPEGRQRK